MTSRASQPCQRLSPMEQATLWSGVPLRMPQIRPAPLPRLFPKWSRQETPDDAVLGLALQWAFSEVLTMRGMILLLVASVIGVSVQTNTATASSSVGEEAVKQITLQEGSQGVLYLTWPNDCNSGKH